MIFVLINWIISNHYPAISANCEAYIEFWGCGFLPCVKCDGISCLMSLGVRDHFAGDKSTEKPAYHRYVLTLTIDGLWENRSANYNVNPY